MISSTAGRRAPYTRSMSGRPPTLRRALARPPIRVLRPPAWITPVIFTRRSRFLAVPSPDYRRLLAALSRDDRAFPQYLWRRDREVEDRRREAARGRSRVEDQVHGAPEGGQDLGRGARRRLAGQIGARSRHGMPQALDEGGG